MCEVYICRFVSFIDTHNLFHSIFGFVVKTNRFSDFKNAFGPKDASVCSDSDEVVGDTVIYTQTKSRLTKLFLCEVVSVGKKMGEGRRREWGGVGERGCGVRFAFGHVPEKQ